MMDTVLTTVLRAVTKIKLQERLDKLIKGSRKKSLTINYKKTMYGDQQAKITAINWTSPNHVQIFGKSLKCECKT